MSHSPRILAFAGSLRSASYNKRLVRYAAVLSREAGAEVTLADLADYRLPVFDQDDETREGKPEAARRFKRLMMDHEGFLISAPEYNSSITGALKNTIDWVSRADDDDPSPKPAFRGKVVALMGASPGAFGGIRGLAHVRAILNHLGCLVLPGQLALSRASKAFDDDGALKDDAQRKRLQELVRFQVDVLRKLNA